MTAPVEVLDGAAGVTEAARRMRALGVRRLLVVGPDGALDGLVSLDDLVAALGAALGDLAAVLRPAAPATPATAATAEANRALGATVRMTPGEDDHETRAT